MSHGLQAIQMHVLGLVTHSSPSAALLRLPPMWHCSGRVGRSTSNTGPTQGMSLFCFDFSGSGPGVTGITQGHHPSCTNRWQHGSTSESSPKALS